MGIKRIQSITMDYQVGEDDVTKITLTSQGSDKTTIYLVEYENRDFIFIGMLEDHEVEYAEHEQATIFDYLN